MNSPANAFVAEETLQIGHTQKKQSDKDMKILVDFLVATTDDVSKPCIVIMSFRALILHRKHSLVTTLALSQAFSVDFLTVL